MRLKGILVMAGLICLSLVVKRSQYPVEMVFGKAAIAEESSEAQVQPLIPPEGADKFYVNFEILFFESQISEYPNAYEAFMRAMTEWSLHVPVRWVFLTEPTNSSFSISHRVGLISVMFVDMTDPLFAYGSLIGLWDHEDQRILIDGKKLEDYPDKAYSVALHEIGHMLGVPHVMSMKDFQGYTGFIVLPENVDAENFVMFPRAIANKPQQVLSSIEVEIAHHNLVHCWTQPKRKSSKSCELFLLDNGD